MADDSSFQSTLSELCACHLEKLSLLYITSVILRWMHEVRGTELAGAGLSGSSVVLHSF